DMRQIVDSLDLTSRLYGDGKPKVIIAHTVKGYGVSNWEAAHMHLGRGKDVARGIEEGRKKYASI
ncbi:MAG TPA: hypothetical protein VLH15_06230, partial [Dehalococcoidales bacterium]|nr:hypothetical protein [Dehalococcoidales bacterium]